MIMQHLIYIKFVKNNIFSIISEITINKITTTYYKINIQKTLKITSSGICGFKNNTKVSPFAWKFILLKDLNFLIEHKIKKIYLKFNSNHYLKQFIIDFYTQNKNIKINNIIVETNYAYNGITKYKK